jgi:hypothetical protein
MNKTASRYLEKSVTAYLETQHYSPAILHIKAIIFLFLCLYFQIFPYSLEVVTKIL